jgi:hypothetical protein
LWRWSNSKHDITVHTGDITVVSMQIHRRPEHQWQPLRALYTDMWEFVGVWQHLESRLASPSTPHVPLSTQWATQMSPLPHIQDPLVPTKRWCHSPQDLTGPVSSRSPFGLQYNRRGGCAAMHLEENNLNFGFLFCFYVLNHFLWIL